MVKIINMLKVLPFVMAGLMLNSPTVAIPMYDPDMGNGAASEISRIDARVPIVVPKNAARPEKQRNLSNVHTHVVNTFENVSDAIDQAQEIYGVISRLFETVNASDVFKLVNCTAKNLPLYVVKDIIDELGGPWAILFGDALDTIDEQKVKDILNILGLERVGKLVECVADIAPKVIAALTLDEQNYLASLAQQFLPNFVIDDFENALNRSFRRNFLTSIQNEVEEVVDWVQDLFDTIKRVFKALSFSDMTKLIKCTSKAFSFNMIKDVVDTLGGVWNIVFGDALSNISNQQVTEIINIIGLPVLNQFIDCSAEVAPKIIAALGPEATSWIANMAQEHLPREVVLQFMQALTQVNGN